MRAMIQTVWDEIPIHYTGTEIDEFVVMPNHIHGIIVIGAVGATPVVALIPWHRCIVRNGQARGPRAGTGACPYGEYGNVGVG